MSIGPLQIAASALSGISALGKNRQQRQIRRDLESRAEFIGGFLSPLKEEYLSGLAPGGFLRDALASGGAEKSARGGELLEAASRAHSTRTSGEGARKKASALAAEMLGRVNAKSSANLKSDDLLARQLLPALGFYTTPSYTDDAGIAAEILGAVDKNYFTGEKKGR